MKIEIYGKKWCSYCYKVKQLCKREKLDFLYKELNKDFTKQEFFEQFSDTDSSYAVFFNKNAKPNKYFFEVDFSKGKDISTILCGTRHRSQQTKTT